MGLSLIQGEEIGGSMIISDFTKPELDFFREGCNFVGVERPLFELRSQGVPLELIAEELNLTADSARKTSQKVNRKITKLLSHF